MSAEFDDAAWLNEHARVSLAELSSLSGLPDAMLRELVDCGALSPLDAADADWTFTARCVVTMRKAGRLGRDFELDANALAVALSLLERIHQLEEDLHAAQAQIPRRVR